MTMAQQLNYPHGSLVTYCGQYWRVCGHTPGGLYLRSPGWEHGQGWWGWNGYGYPVQVATVAPQASPLLYHA
jgi:hypothetical protein